MDLFNKQKVLSLERELYKYKDIIDISVKVKKLEQEYDSIYNLVSSLSADLEDYTLIRDDLVADINSYSDKMDLIHVGLYDKIYNLNTGDEYKTKLTKCRDEQKIAIARNKAINVPEQLYIDESARSGNRLIKGMSNTILTAFNLQCSNLIEKVSGLNIVATQDKIYKLAKDINKYSGLIGVLIDDYYLELKIAELYISYEYALKLEEEKEDLRIKKEMLREQNLLTAELAENKKKLEKELKHFTNQLAKESNNQQILDKIQDIESKISANDYRLANQKAGFVYIIANSAIPNALKIGVSRRLDINARFAELNNASVPYKFKIHCVIFSDDCFALESALHREFDSRRVNVVNKKKEFFYVGLDEVEEVVKSKYDPSAKFYKDIVCEDFLISEKRRLDK